MAIIIEKIDRILKKDEGLSLINSLSTAKDGEGKDLNFFYGTEGSTGIGLENPQMQGNVRARSFLRGMARLGQR